MLKVLLLFLCADTYFCFNLHFDNNQYEDLLVSISPDIPGQNLKSIFTWYLYLNLEDNAEETIQNIKTWITEVIA